MAYMAYRESVVVNVAIRDAPKRAAMLLEAILRFRALVVTCVCIESFPIAPILHADAVSPSF